MPSRSPRPRSATTRRIPMLSATSAPAALCLSDIIGTSHITATARSPRMRCAMCARTVLSNPPEKHTAALPRPLMRLSAATIRTSYSSMIAPPLCRAAACPPRRPSSRPSEGTSAETARQKARMASDVRPEDVRAATSDLDVYRLIGIVRIDRWPSAGVRLLDRRRDICDGHGCQHQHHVAVQTRFEPAYDLIALQPDPTVSHQDGAHGTGISGKK